MNKKWAFLFSFFKNMKRKRAAAKQRFYLKSIISLKIKLEDNGYELKELNELNQLVSKIMVDLSIFKHIDKSFKVSFYSLSTQSALEAVRKQFYYRETIVNSHLISIINNEIPLNTWWSGEDTVTHFITFIKDMLLKNIYLESALVNYNETSKGVGLVTQAEEEFINSLLYRLLLNDFLSLIILLMGYTYDNPDKNYKG